MHCFQIVALQCLLFHAVSVSVSRVIMLQLQSSDVLRAAGSAIVELAKPTILAASDSAAQWQTQSGHSLTHPATEFEKAGA